MFWFRSLLRRKNKTVFADLNGKSVSDEEYNRIRKEQEDYAMQLLDKISKHGEKCLKKSEKAFLSAYGKSNFLS